MARKRGWQPVVLGRGTRAGEIAAVALNGIGIRSKDLRKVALFDCDNATHRDELGISGMHAIAIMAGANTGTVRSLTREAYERGRARRRERDK